MPTSRAKAGVRLRAQWGCELGTSDRMEGLPAPSAFRDLVPEQLRLLQARPGRGLLRTAEQSLSRRPRVEARRAFPAGMQAKDRRGETADPASPGAPATDAVTSQGRDALFPCLPGLNSGPPRPGPTAGSADRGARGKAGRAATRQHKDPAPLQTAPPRSGPRNDLQGPGAGASAPGRAGAAAVRTPESPAGPRGRSVCPGTGGGRLRQETPESPAQRKLNKSFYLAERGFNCL